MKAKFVRNEDSKKSLNVGENFLKKSIRIKFDFKEINKDEFRAWDYIEVFKAILKQMDTNVNIIEEKLLVLYESGDYGELDYGGIIEAIIITNKSIKQIEKKLKLSEYENQISRDIIDLSVNIIEYE